MAALFSAVYQRVYKLLYQDYLQVSVFL